ncbi:cytochrome C oxidase subunit II [Nostoc sp. 'Peltigera membranacea cyanobiont' 213]|uniref:cytochrome c oxidase subunit II n=1 Tax=unclassified Nostoc TaxID=2593658 RepID=UPI000B953DA3|nr:cytochrome c oxidase subunit II [Nostoc sp. 'Peltigera membranacea cyanobiont' 213]OYD87743.1 cytochrome C oxidase subunit II [Nostoc sp. 'Peltigera membranacea cyanobiont' 213]
MKIRNILILSAIAIALTAVSLWIGQWTYSWMPPQAAAESQLVDKLFSFLITLGAFIFLGVTGTLIYSAIFHRAEQYDPSDGPPIEGNITLEIVWTAIPILLVFWIATYSYQIYEQMGIQGPMEAMHLHIPIGMKSASAAPINGDAGIVSASSTSSTVSTDATSNVIPFEDIEVNAKQWAWVFRYPEKGITSTELHLPVNHRIRLAMQSEDVLHGFYIPAFRVKQDIIPNRNIDFEFTPIRIGKYQLTDSEFSGTYFATMRANVVVESPEDYKKWLAEAANRKPCTANNQAASEYAQESKELIKGWVTVAPAQAPVVNYSN